jgi:hypothetical protein
MGDPPGREQVVIRPFFCVLVGRHDCTIRVVATFVTGVPHGVEWDLIEDGWMTNRRRRLPL